MIIQVKKDINEEQQQQIFKTITDVGYTPRLIQTQLGAYIIGTGKGKFDIRRMGNLPGVLDIHRVTDNFKLVSRMWKVKDTAVDLGDGVSIGRDDFTIMAGPCSVESTSQTLQTAIHLQENGLRMMRGGVFKPRSSPYSFRGAGMEGLKEMAEICRKHEIKIVTEVMELSQIDQMYDYVDIFQVGARNSQNFNLLDALGKVDKPVLLKRGMSGTIDELLQSAEYIFYAGNEKIILCERGIRTHENAYRNTLDLNAVPILKEKSHLPVIVDPSHGIGIRRFVEPMALAAVMAGADGIILEVHDTPEKALSDGQQTLSFDEARNLYQKANQTYQFLKNL